MEIFSSMKYFAGTVAVPNTFPELATIEFIARATLTGGGQMDEVLKITERKPQWTIVRIVSVRDVVGVFTTTETNPDQIRRQWLVRDHWRTGEAQIRALPGAETGIAYISEQASVVVTFEFALNAAECAECYPPVMYSYSSCCIPPCRSLDHPQRQLAPRDCRGVCC